MKKYLSIIAVIILFLHFSGLFADFVLLFKQEDGHTNWQYVANWSSFVLIVLLSITATFLFFSRKTTKKTNIELEAIKNDLEIRVQERTATLDESNKRLKEEVGQHLETTKRLHSSENYIKNILKSMPSMLVGLNPDGNITQWNEKAEKYTGIKTEDAIGKNLWKAYPIITITANQVQESLEQQSITTIRQSQRGLFHFDITIYPIQGENETGVVLLIDDVTQQVKSENKLIQKDRMSSMGELASSMAYDMNVPLQGMLTDIRKITQKMSHLSANVQADISDEISEINAELADAINQGQQATAIVDNLLDFAGSQQNIKHPAVMTEVMEHSLELAQSILPLPCGMNFSQIKIEKEYENDLSKVSCHIIEIQQVFLSLLRHCFQALGKVKEQSFVPTIKIKIIECYDAIWLKISHNGVGLTSDEQQSIFEPYFSNDPLDSEDDADKRLSFSHFIITEHHEGQMAVTSDTKVGTTFHMQFQLK